MLLSHVYVADSYPRCVWRVSSDAKDMKRCWTKSPSDKFRPCALSMTSSRLLVTSYDTNELMQLDEAGGELRRVPLPEHMYPRHAVESPTGTFIVSHENTELKPWQVSEVNTEGQVLRQFSGSPLSSLGWPYHIAVDSQGNICSWPWQWSYFAARRSASTTSRHHRWTSTERQAAVPSVLQGTVRTTDGRVLGGRRRGVWCA